MTAVTRLRRRNRAGLTERGLLRGLRRLCFGVDAFEVSVPATVQATIAARIDRLDLAANAA